MSHQFENMEIIQLPKFEDNRGNLSFYENNHQIPFSIQRMYWIYDVPGGEIRGGHAFAQQEEFVVMLSGSMDIILNNGNEERKIALNRSYQGLYIPKLIWRHFENFSTNAVVLIAASTKYDEDDYIRDFEVFRKQCSN